MKGVEPIIDKQQLTAIVFRRKIPVKGVKFMTEDMNPFQVGLHARKKGISLSPHVHKLNKPLVINTIQEILFVQSGKIRVNLYQKCGRRLAQKILNQGDSILLMNGGHGVDFLEDSRIFEVKQGPYPGTEHAKIYLKHDTGK